VKNPTILYIAGYGRSGSTLLERVLNSHERIFGGGEITSLLTLVQQPHSICACGHILDDCEFWSPVLTRLRAKYEKLSTLQPVQHNREALLSFPRLFSQVKGRRSPIYRELNQMIFRSLCEQIKEVDIIVDSSKTARNAFFRPIALKREVGFDVKMIHLVRDGRGCMWSNVKGSNRMMEQNQDPGLPLAMLRTALHWPLANIGAHLYQAQAGRQNYLRIRYEDFVDDPEIVLTELGHFLDLDFKNQIQLIKERKPIPISHQLAGNRIRSKKELIIQKDDEWMSKLKLWQRVFFMLINWPLSILYGYLS